MGEGHRLLGDYRGGGDMRVGSLVKVRYRDKRIDKIGVITSIGSPNPVAQILWLNGEEGAIHTKWLEVLCK